ncbi:MAG: DHA2 family efflux MFS transporter permease subunit [Acidimicrobiales bacterium]|nr:DHA2 family efflux MFS transporter permease subunit [Acidimicrobiales bacterium]
MPVLDRKWWTLLAVCTATFMLLLDITVVNVALPAIQRSLHSSFSDLQWVVDAYSLTLAAFLLTAGVLGDMYGRRAIFAIGLVVFTASSLVCGLSSSSTMLNLARAVQGVGGAIMFATSVALIASAFQGRERGTAFGIYGAVLGGAVAIGPLVGGALTSSVGWQWIFFVNVPVGVLAVLLTLTKVVESREPNTRRIDWVGFVSLSGMLFMLILALVRGNYDGWTSPLILGLFFGSGALLIVFLVNEWRTPDPMLDLNLFKRPAMCGVSITAFTLAGSIFAMFLYITLYVQDGLGYGPLAAGLRFLPITVMAFVVAPFAGRLTVRVQSRYLLGAGLLLVAGGLLLMGTTNASSAWTQLLPGFFVTGVGIGLVNPVLASASVSVVPVQRSGMASGANATFRQIGIATGVAALGAIFASEIQTKTIAALNASAAGRLVVERGGNRLGLALQAGGVRDTLGSIPVAARRVLLDAYRTGFSSTLNELMVIGAAVAFAGAVLSFVLVRQKDFVPSGPPSGAGSPPPSGRVGAGTADAPAAVGAAG